MIPQRKPSAGTSYQIEAFSSCVFEIARHAKAHWDEFGARKDIRKLDVDWETYLRADRVGRIVLATVRTEAGRLIGYLAMAMHPDFHDRNALAAESVVYYVEKRPMRGLIQRNLIRFMRDHLLASGVKYQRISSEIAHGNNSILRNCGYEPTSVFYTLKG